MWCVPELRDYEYVRRGTANIFCIVAPKTGRHLTHATTNRKARRFAAAMKRISDAYLEAKRIHIILDNLNTHRLKSLIDAYGQAEGRRLWRRFVIHYTPKHGSWLNPAEIEVSLWSRECMGRDRIATLCELKQRTRVWNRTADRTRRKINWRFTTADAPPRLPVSPRHYAWAEGLEAALIDAGPRCRRRMSARGRQPRQEETLSTFGPTPGSLVCGPASTRPSIITGLAGAR